MVRWSGNNLHQQVIRVKMLSRFFVFTFTGYSTDAPGIERDSLFLTGPSFLSRGTLAMVRDKKEKDSQVNRLVRLFVFGNCNTPITASFTTAAWGVGGESGGALV